MHFVSKVVQSVGTAVFSSKDALKLASEVE